MMNFDRLRQALQNKEGNVLLRNDSQEKVEFLKGIRPIQPWLSSGRQKAIRGPVRQQPRAITTCRAYFPELFTKLRPHVFDNFASEYNHEYRKLHKKRKKSHKERLRVP
jgi:hypothetical protein